MDIEDATNVARIYGQEAEPGGELDNLTPERALEIVRSLALAGESMAKKFSEQANELARMRARLRTMEQAGDPRGKYIPEQLWEGMDGGGRRHFLGGRPIHAGMGIMLLTSQGWLGGRYEWHYGDEPLFYFGTPGSHLQVSVPIHKGMRLAWPTDA